MTDHQKWADIEADDDFEPSFLLSTSKGFETKPDKDGIKTVTKYTRNDRGETVKIVRRVRVIVKSQRINKAVYARKNLPQFGMAISEILAVKGTTIVSHDDCYIEPPKNARTFKKMKDDDDDFYCSDLSQMKTTHALKQKLKALRDDLEGVESKPDGLEVEEKVSKLIPSRLKDGGGASKFKDDRKLKGEECTIRVTNLAEDVNESDLRELFGCVGQINRIYLATHRASGNFKGFAFITYNSRADAESAIRKLNRHGYDNLLLNVEWAKPSNRS